MKFGAGSNRHISTFSPDWMCTWSLNTQVENLCFRETSIQPQKQRHSKALFKESPRSLITETDFLKPLMNSGTRVEKIAIAKKYIAFPKQRTFARLHLLLKMGHHSVNRRNKLVNDIRAIAIGDTFCVLAPNQYHRKQISLFCLPIITYFQLHSGKRCCSLNVSLTGEIN